MERPESTLTVWLRKIPADELGLYGFQSRHETKRAAMGNPIPMYHPAIDTNLVEIDSLKTRLISGPVLWYIPLLVESRIACLLEGRTDSTGKSRIQGIGFRYLAERLGAGEGLVRTDLGEDFRIEALISLGGPPMDLAIASGEEDGEIWVGLLGGETPTARVLKKSEVGEQVRAAARVRIEPPLGESFDEGAER
jgi:hypothetical protein